MNNFFKIFIAFYSRNKTIAILSITGLSLGLLSILILTAKLVNENSYNKDISNGDRIYRIISNNEGFKQPHVPFQLGELLKSRIPEIDDYARYVKLDGIIGYIYGIKGNDKIIEPQFYTGDNSFMKIMDIKTSNGSNLNKLEPGDIILSEKTALKYYGKMDVIGQEFSIMYRDYTYRFIVVDVFKDIAWNNTFRPEMICDISFYVQIETDVFRYTKHEVTNTLEVDNPETLIVRNENISEKEFEEKFRSVTNQLYENNHRKTRLYLQNINDIYLNSTDLKNDSIIKGDKQNLFYYKLSILLILFIASFNYIILQTSISSQRNLEVGVRKVFGASKKDLIIQYFSEAFLITLISIPVIIIFYFFYSVYLEEFMFSEVRFHLDKLIIYAFYILVVIFIVALISSSYIVGYISSLNPIDAINGTILNKKKKNTHLLFLLGFQLFISLILVTFSSTLFQQISFALNKSIGIDKDKLILIYFDSNISKKDYKLLKTDLLKLSTVKNVTGGVLLPPTNAASFKPFFKNNDDFIICESYSVNSDFFKTFGIPITEGRSFDFNSRVDLRDCIIINKTAVDKFGFTDPLFEKIEGYQIIGITDDFNFHPLHKKIEPSLFFPRNRITKNIAVQFKSSMDISNINDVRNIIDNLFDNKMYNITTFKKSLEELYAEDIGLRNFVSFYSIIISIITLIGVIGITLHISKNESTNMSIRKVFGASNLDILKYFTGKVAISCIIASFLSIPISVIMSNQWLNSYYYALNLSWIVYLGVILLFIFLVLFVSIAVLYKTITDSPTKYLK